MRHSVPVVCNVYTFDSDTLNTSNELLTSDPPSPVSRPSLTSRVQDDREGGREGRWRVSTTNSSGV